MNADRSLRIPLLIATAVLLLAVTGTGFAIRSKDKVYISEVCTHNDGISYDSVGAYHDYIILKNETDRAVDLNGYALSDDRVELRKFVFGDVVLEPEETLMVWADLPSEFSGVFTDENAIYTGFRLKDHESLFLTDQSGQVIDALRLPVMERNLAYLRTGAKAQGTVGRSSLTDADAPVISALVKTPVLSAKSGYYTDAFELTIDGFGNEVFFTVDGSDPCTSGMLYNGSIPVYDRSDQPNLYAGLGPVSLIEDTYMPQDPVDKGMIVRAVARREDGTFSKETAGTYFVGSHMQETYMGTCTLSIISDPQGLFSGARGIYVTGNVWDMNKEKAEEIEADPHLSPTNYNCRGKGWRRDAHLTLFDGAGNCLYDEDDTISIHGNWARALNQKGFNLRPLENIAGECTPVFEGLFPDAGNTLMLRTGGEDDMPLTNFRDVLNNRISQDLHVGAQRAIPCQVFLDGEYWGCYNLQDRLDESYIAARYGVKAEDVLLIKNFEAVSERESDLTAYYELYDFAEENDLSDDLNYRRFCNMMDIDSLIDYYCAEIYFANDDAYDNNVAFWKTRHAGLTPYADGKWRCLLIDTDCSAGYREEATADVDSFAAETARGVSPLTDPLFAALIENAEFRAAFRERFLYLAEHDFSYERVEPVISELEKAYLKPQVLSLRRFADPSYTEETYAANVQTVRDFYRERGAYICGYLMQHLGN
ncbi:MAG: CotH kinase family protein [Lachnospiraceae bacterium]|nr:CotH kinase family protein [Lachnospiraceae bacterium]